MHAEALIWFCCQAQAALHAFRQIDTCTQTGRQMKTHRQTDRLEQVIATDSLSSCTCALQVGDQYSIVAEFKRVEGEKQDVVQQQNMMRGSLATIRDGVHRAQRDLASPNYRDIDMRYRKQLIELKTTEMANSDLDKYHKVGTSHCCLWYQLEIVADGQAELVAALQLCSFSFLVPMDQFFIMACVVYPGQMLRACCTCTCL